MVDSRQAMRTFLRCMKLQTGDVAKNERKQRIMAYYNYVGDEIKSTMYMGYHDATDRSDWIQTFQIGKRQRLICKWWFCKSDGGENKKRME